jgi:hypothetical protein
VKHTCVTGKAAQERPWLNELAPNPVLLGPDALTHDRSGIRRRTRRSMDRLAALIKRHPSYAGYRDQMEELKAEAGL